MSFSATSNVPIEFLPNIGNRTAQVLRTFGVGTIGQFKQIPEKLLIELFGPNIKFVHAYVNDNHVGKSNFTLNKKSASKKNKRNIFQKLQFVTSALTML